MNCGLCGNRKAIDFLTVGPHRLVRCKACSLIYTVNFGYEAISYVEDDYFIQKNQYVSRWDEFCNIFESLLDKIIRFKKGGRLLDVGAGVGTLMYVASQKGFKVEGVEVSTWASTFAKEEKGLNVVAGTLEDAQLETASFDVVVVNHVLEHVNNPLAMLAEIRRILKKDGLLVIGVPNIGSIMARLRGDRWASLRPKEHIWHFTPTTLKRLTSQAGFDEIYFEAKENYPVAGCGLRDMLLKTVNLIALLTNHSEAMLLFATKKSDVGP